MKFLIMENNITLTNDEIHTIRVEHSEKTGNLPFEEYKRRLDAEITPTLRRLEEIKKSQNRNNKLQVNKYAWCYQHQAYLIDVPCRNTTQHCNYTAVMVFPQGRKGYLL